LAITSGAEVAEAGDLHLGLASDVGIGPVISGRLVLYVSREKFDMSILSLDGRSIIFKTFALLSPIS
jgi:hypothetical protein